MPIIAGPQNVESPTIGSSIFDLLLDELEKHTNYLNNIDVNTNNVFYLLGGASLGNLLVGDYNVNNDSSSNVLTATINNGSRLDHLSNNLDHLSDNSILVSYLETIKNGIITYLITLITYLVTLITYLITLITYLIISILVTVS